MVNNAETLAHLALIARWGADWFREVGTPDAPGTALLSAGGAFVQPGVYEAPLGEASTNVVEIAGGLVDVPIAFLIGGYGGHWVSAEEFLSTSWDPEDLRVRGLNLGMRRSMGTACRELRADWHSSDRDLHGWRKCWPVRTLQVWPFRAC